MAARRRPLVGSRIDGYSFEPEVMIEGYETDCGMAGPSLTTPSKRVKAKIRPWAGTTPRKRHPLREAWRQRRPPSVLSNISASLPPTAIMRLLSWSAWMPAMDIISIHEIGRAHV